MKSAHRAALIVAFPILLAMIVGILRLLADDPPTTLPTSHSAAAAEPTGLVEVPELVREAVAGGGQTVGASIESGGLAPPIDLRQGTHLLRGQVVSESGEPISGAEVSVIAEPMNSDAKSRLFKELRSGLDGRFELSDVMMPARLRVTVQCAGYLRFELDQARAKITGVVADLGQLVLSRGFRLRGRVIDDQGAPLAATVWLIRSRQLDLPPSSRVTPAQTDREGYFEAAFFELRTLLVAAHAPGYAHGFLMVPMTARGVTAIPDLVLGPPARVAGRVVDLGGEPRPKAKLRILFAPSRESLLQDSLERPGLICANVVSDASGQFEVNDLPRNGWVKVSCQSPDGEIAGSSLVPAAEAHNVTVVLDVPTSVLSLTVLDPGGVPLQMPFELQMWRVGSRSSGSRVRRSLSPDGDSGTVVVGDLWSGAWNVQVTAGLGESPVSEVFLPPDSTVIPLIVRLEAGVSLTGTVHNEVGATLAGVDVTLSPAPSAGGGSFVMDGVPSLVPPVQLPACADGTTGADGQYALSAPRAGSYWLQFSSGNDVRFDLIALRADTRHDIVLGRPGSLHVSVVDGDGRPQGPAQLGFVGRATRPIIAETGADGELDVELPPDAYFVDVRPLPELADTRSGWSSSPGPPPFRARPPDVVLAPGEQKALRLELAARSGSLDVIVGPGSKTASLSGSERASLAC